MNEVEKHYGVTPASGAGHGAGSGRDESFASTARETARAATDRVSETYDKAAGKARDLYESATDWASDTYGDASRNVSHARRRTAAHLSRGRDTVGDFVEENPIMVGVVGLAAGLLVGALLPTTRRENQLFGRYADEVRDQGLRYAQSIAEEGRHLVEDQLSRLPQARRDRDTGDETAER